MILPALLLSRNESFKVVSNEQLYAEFEVEIVFVWWQR